MGESAGKSRVRRHRSAGGASRTEETAVTEIEIVHDPKGAMGGLQLGEDHELWPDGDWIRYARRKTGIADLFVYRHRREGTWVLCKWLFKPGETTTPTCLELSTMRYAPDWPGSGRLVGDALLRRTRPAEDMVADMKREMRDAAQQKEHEREQKAYSRQNAVKYMRTHGMEESAMALESGEVPWGSTGEQSEAMNETVSELVSLAKRST